MSESGTRTAQSVLDGVKTIIEQAHTDNRHGQAVMAVFADREIGRRDKLLVDGFDKLVEATKLYDNVNKPDGKTFASADVSESPTVTFSEKRRGEIAKAKKTVDDLTKALEAALVSAQYDALEKALKKSGQLDPA